MLEVVSAHYLDGFKLRLSFSNGDSGIVDLADALWGPVFEPLKDPALFRRFRVSPVLRTICWENDADFAPEFLHKLMLEQAVAPDAGAQRR